MKKIKDLGAFIAISLIGVCIVGGSVLAEDGEYNRRSHITSKGVINYSNSTIVLDSSDLTYLADEIDHLERAYKSSTMEALNRISTFYASTNGDISHERDDNNVSPDMAAELKFSDLYEGILKSQSVDHLTNVQAKDADGKPLYYADRNAGENKDLIASTTEANDYPIFIRSAVASSLTAGTAAWVDGHMIIGNGADNKAYYNIGYADGAAANAPNGADIEYVRHYHGDNCYKTINIKETGQYYEMNEDHYHESGGSNKRNCYVCTVPDENGKICGTHNYCYSNGHYGIACGYTNGQILSATIVYK